MKKFFAILLVLALVVGFVFAADGTENHTLTVYSVVGEKVPAFQLRYGNVKTNTNVKFTDGTTYDDYLADATTRSATNLDNAQATSFDISDITTNNGVHTAAFTVYLVKNKDGYNAKSTAKYTLTFSDGVFDDVYRKGVKSDLKPTNISVAPNDSAVEAEGNSAVGITSITPAAANPTSVATPVVFSGTTVNSDELLLATATYTWTADQTIDMGTYFADIQLTITKN